MYMVMLVHDNPNQVDTVIEAWSKAVITGATILESTGIHRLQPARQFHARQSFGERAPWRLGGQLHPVSHRAI